MTEPDTVHAEAAGSSEGGKASQQPARGSRLREGVVIGVSSGVVAGLILAGVFALRDAMQFAGERREQVAHLHALIDDGWWMMCGHHVPPTRTNFYNKLMRDLNAVLAERAT